METIDVRNLKEKIDEYFATVSDEQLEIDLKKATAYDFGECGSNYNEYEDCQTYKKYKEEKEK
jgi:hypothetical protein